MSWQHSPHLQTLKLFGLIVGISLAAFYLLQSVLIPVIISFTLYALFRPAVDYLVRQDLNHSLSILLVLLVLTGVSTLAIAYALPALVDQASLLQARLPQIAAQLEGFLQSSGETLSQRMGAEVDLSGIVLSILAKSSSLGQAALIEVSNRLFSFILIFLLVPFLTYFLLRDFRQARNRLMNWLPNSAFELGWMIYHNVASQLQIYTHGVMLQSLIMATFCAIGFSLIGLDIPVLMGAITGLFNLVPYIGPIISIILALLVGAAMTPFDPSILYLSVLVILCAQILDNLVVIPSVLANAVNLHPVQAILGIIVFGSLFGTVGVILAVPAIAAARIVFGNIYTDINRAGVKSTRVSPAG